MASIIKHGENHWRAHFYARGIRKSKVFKTREAAQEWADRQKVAADAGVNLPANSPSFLGHNTPSLINAAPKTVIAARLAAPIPPLEIVAAAIRVPKSSAIYFLLLDGEVVYIGQSVDVLSRLYRHRREGKKFDAFAMIECEPGQMDELERLYIRAFVPPGNLTMGGRQATVGAAA